MLERDPPPGIVCYPVNDNCTHLEAHIRGPIDSPFEDGTFKLDVQIPQRYPFDPPQIRFVTPIYHPNIDEAGRICADILKMPPAGSWKPALNLSTVLLALAGLMSYPNPDDPLEVDIATEFKENISVFRHKAKQSTLKYATNSPNSSSSKCSVSQNEIASLQKSETRSNRESQSSTIPEETCNESESAISRQRPPTSKKMSKLSLSKQKGVNHNQENSSNVQEINQVCDNKLNSEERVVVSKYLSTGSSNAVASPTKSSKTQVLSTRTDKHDMNPPISDINIAKEQELIPLAQITHSAPSKSVHSQCPERHKDRSKMIESLPVATSNEHMLKTELIEIIDVDEVTISPKENVSFSVGDDRKNEDTVNTPSQTTLVNITNSLHANTPKPESSTLRKRKLLSLGKNKKLKM
ncbi:Ubiquitin-conjugating enzyme E2 T [Umbelopsis sp. WA50703]